MHKLSRSLLVTLAQLSRQISNDYLVPNKYRLTSSKNLVTSNTWLCITNHDDPATLCFLTSSRLNFFVAVSSTFSIVIRISLLHTAHDLSSLPSPFASPLEAVDKRCADYRCTEGRTSNLKKAASGSRNTILKFIFIVSFLSENSMSAATNQLDHFG